MPKTAFSTVTCPQWTLEQVADAAARHEFDGVELRTFGTGSASFVCDPALTASVKTRRLFREAGVKIASLATSVRFDKVIRPRVIGRVIGDPEASIRQAKLAIGLASQLECPFVRVFGFEVPSNEKKSATMALIVERLKGVADHAHRTGVRVALENGGSFCSADDLNEILDRVRSPLIGVSWCVKSGLTVGEVGLPTSIARRTFVLRLRDVEASGGLGGCAGDCECKDAVQGLMRDGPDDAWVVYEWCNAWTGGNEMSVDEVLAKAANQLFAWGERREVAAPTA